MILDPDAIINDFTNAAAVANLTPPSKPIRHETQLAPHSPHPLPAATCAVYVFSLNESYGRRCPAGPHRVIKVGKAGLHSNPRFQSQHYNPRSAQSTVAGALAESRILWPYLGINGLSEDEAGAWVRRNTDRDNFYLAAEDAALLADLEGYVRARLGPALEGG